ncbi:MAG: TIGR04255 family protein [Ktedonobacteraceae bacterium]
MSKQYKNPPLSEVVCEFQFGQDSSWDLTIPGLVYEKVRETFPKRKQIARVTMGLNANEGEVSPQIGATPIMQFASENEKLIMQVGVHLLSINSIKPYPSWEQFFPQILKSFDTYREVANPKSIHRIGLRYVNTIDIPGSGLDLEDYFEFRPYLGPKLPGVLGPFMMGVQLPCEDSRDMLNLQLASLAGLSIDVATIILDLDYFLAQPGSVALDDVSMWLESAHTHVEETFEGCITDRLRQHFEE